MTPLLGLFGTLVVDVVKSWIDQKKINAEHQVKIVQTRTEAEIERIKKESDSELDWDRIQALNSTQSWKDEFWTILLAIPLMMCFVPGLAKYAHEGFQHLEDIPEWYIIAVGVAIASAFGYRRLVEIFTHRRKK